jgi:hypothetical protein
MKIPMIKKLSCAYVGGMLGAFIDSFNIWFLGRFGITSLLGIGLQPQFSSDWLYPRLVWGGIWGLLFILPIFKERIYLRGMLFSLAPTAIVLFVMFPGMGKGTLGLGFGVLTPVLVLLLNFIWGIVAAFWYRYGTR